VILVEVCGNGSYSALMSESSSFESQLMGEDLVPIDIYWKGSTDQRGFGSDATHLACLLKCRI
jgi:hypothetical protein